MIHYQLACAADHGFDGWFRDSAGFEKQAEAGLVSCPKCGSTEVRRALMAPAVGRRGTKADSEAILPVTPPPGTPPVGKQPDKAAAALPDQVRAVLARMRSEIEKNCDYVGPGFAAEARRIHNGETEARGIYGETTPEEAVALKEDGIEVASIPWVDRAEG